MKVRTIQSKQSHIDTVILFAETRKEDYFYNHVLHFVQDVDDAPDLQKADKYRTLPDDVLATDRQCYIKPIKVKRSN